LGSSIIELRKLTQAASADWQLIRLDPKFFFAREPSIPAPVDVDARSFEDRGDAHLLVAEDRVKAVDQQLILV